MGLAMSIADDNSCRLCLVTPSDFAPASFAPALDQALAGGDIASIIVTAAPAELARLSAAVVPRAQSHGVAVLIHNDSEIAAKTSADGIHIDDRNVDLAEIVAKLHPDKIVGVGNLTSRHNAMVAGQAEPDYLFFGRLDGDTDPAIFPKALALAEWWAALFQIPAVVMGGNDVASVRQARNAGVEFVALRRAIWEHPDGPGAAIAAANRLLAEAPDTVR
jgi:thiamine-phosphate pyrophosphorylase